MQKVMLAHSPPEDVAAALAAATMPASAQDVGKDVSNTGVRRNSDIRTPATYVETRPNIDGVLDEPFWQTIEPITDFLQRLPNEGAEPTRLGMISYAVFCLNKKKQHAAHS